MIQYTIARRLFVVPLANNDHGKSALVRALLSQATQRSWQRPQRGARELWTPWGRHVDSYVFIRSYQEELASNYKSVSKALEGEDPNWASRDLIILPSHLNPSHCTHMIALAHAQGFDAICVPVLLDMTELPRYSSCLELPWDERWTLSNPTSQDPTAQVDALGRDLWTQG